MFQSVGLKVNVRALEYHEPFLFAGVGSFLCVYRLDEGKHLRFVHQCRLRLNGPIIGIRIISQTSLADQSLSTSLLAFSTRHIVKCSLRLSDTSDSIDCTDFEVNLKHWIIDCIIIAQCAFILNARNEVIVYDLDGQRVRHRLSSSQKCILYSGRFMHTTSNGLVIASGSVFKQIFIWSIQFSLENLNDGESFQVNNIQTLDGHDGVLFSLFYDSINNMLISCSDDRTVRLWKGCNQSSPPADEFCGHYWESNSFALVHSYYGHSARIWKVMSINHDNIPLALSVGEDANLFVWSLVSPFGEVKKMSSFNNNRIWTFAIVNDRIALGGSSGSIQLLPIDELLERKEFALHKQTLDYHHAKSFFILNDQPEGVDGLCISADGEIVSFPNDKKQDFVGNDEHLMKILSQHSFSDVNFNRSKLVAGTKCGSLAVFQTSDTPKLIAVSKLFDQKIIKVHFVAEDKLMVSLGQGVVHLVRFEPSKLELMKDWSLKLLSSKYQLTNCGLAILDVLIIGDASGNITVHKVGSAKALWTFPNIYSTNMVTSIKHKPNTNLIYASCKNSRITEFHFDINDRGEIIDFVQLRTFKFLPSMNWIADFEFDEEWNIKFVYGFESDRFTVWDMDDERIVFAVECGGGHRKWDFVVNRAQDKYHCQFGYIKQDQLITTRGDIVCSDKRTQSTFYLLPRKINSCNFLRQSTNKMYFLVAGEENYVQLIEYITTEDVFSLKLTLYAHESTVGVVKCVPNHKYLYVLTAGGQSQLVVWKVWQDIDDGGQLLIQERCNTFMGTYHRHMQIENKNRKKIRKDSENLVDVRYLDVDCVLQDNNNNNNQAQLLIIASCSDTTYRIMSYDDNRRVLTTHHKISIDTFCIHIARFVRLDSQPPGDVVFTLGSNNGHFYFGRLALDRLVEAPRIVFSKKLHEAGINSLDFYRTEDSLLMLTGGDDNSIHWSIVSPQLDVISTILTESSIHTCQITGLQFLDATHFLSTSIDQKVILWHCPSRDKLNAVDTFHTDVADVSCLIVIDQKQSLLLLVCGDGLELIKQRAS